MIITINGRRLGQVAPRLRVLAGTRRYAVEVSKLRLLCLFVPVFFFGAVTGQSSDCLPVDLRCEYLESPIGVDDPAPRLAWRLADSRRGAKQEACRLIVGVDSAEVAQDNATMWDSQRINSDEMLVRYRGKTLQPFTTYYWKVQVWDKDNKVSSSAVSSFETGMMDKKNWQGAWISDNNNRELKPAPLFRKEFEAPKKIRSARAYITAAGLYELYINGEKAGNHRLDPVYTRFDRRLLYVAHDVTRLLQDGKNAIGVMLGNGWYNHQSTAVWDFHNAPWRARPAFCLDLRIVYEDGTTETVSSGRDWKTSQGPIIFNSIYTAEHYDARLEQKGWDMPGFDDSKWKNTIYRSAPSTNIVSQLLHPVRDMEVIPATKMTHLNDTAWVFDLGRNISGVTSIKVKGAEGTVIRLKHGERIFENGHVDISNIDIHYRPTDDTDPFQTDIFILAGEGVETFKPRFNYKGFQYVEVTASAPIELTRESLTGYFMHSAVPVSGELSSSSPLLNKLWRATNNSYLSNLFGYPTDCPQREKNGWTGDAHIAIETGLYGFDGITVYEKWLNDHLDEQQPNGVLPSIIPTSGWGYEWANGPDWTSTIAIIPWNIYLFYGDETLLIRCYEAIKKYVDNISRLSPSGITSWGLGDWVPVKSKSPVELTSTAYYYTDVSILAKAAAMSGRTDDHEKYTALAEKIKNAFNDRFLNVETATYGQGQQTEMSVPLFWGLVPEDIKERVAANLARRVEDDGLQLDVGLLGQKAILNALSMNGYSEIAYKLASRDTYPSWGWWIVNGATTLYENWRVDAQRDASLNHIMFGEIGAWLYKGLGGINPDPENPGFKNTILKPFFPEGLSSFSCSHNSPYGKIVSEWERKGKKIIYRVTIPPNASAHLYLPEGYKPGKTEVIEHVSKGNGNGKLSAGGLKAGLSRRLSVRAQWGEQLPHILEAGSYEVELTAVPSFTAGAFSDLHPDE